MEAVERQHKTTIMPFAIRHLEERDIAQSAEIDRDAFSSHFPPTSFRRELKNRRACYLVAWRRDDMMESDTPVLDAAGPPPDGNDLPIIDRLIRGARSLWTRPSAWEPGQQFVAGFMGIWYMVDEAHIVSVGVRREYRGRGIGELLLIGGIEHAMARGARAVSLEVRVSNHVARSLYLKYGLKERGARKGYYSDNREDAVIMTTDPIHLPPYHERIRSLVHEHEQRWGRSERRTEEPCRSA